MGTRLGKSLFYGVLDDEDRAAGKTLFQILKHNRSKKIKLGVTDFLHQIVELPGGVEVSDGHVLESLPA